MSESELNDGIPEELAKVIPSLKGLECWYVSCGGAVGSTFELSLGKKVRRTVPLKNRAHSDEFRHFEGEVSLFVWCSWRLDGTDGPVTSWDDTNESYEAGLEKLKGSRIESAEIVPLAWDMNIAFSNSLFLRIFCDHVPGEPSFDGNWDIRLRDMSIAVGPGTRCRIQRRAPPENLIRSSGGS